jgi:hypothetical protein
MLSVIMQNFTYKPLIADCRCAECRGALILIVMKGKASHYAGHFVDLALAILTTRLLDQGANRSFYSFASLLSKPNICEQSKPV